jgi:hypothetical protein
LSPLTSIVLVNSLAASQVDQVQLRHPNCVCHCVTTFQRYREDAMRPSRSLVHWSLRHLSYEITSHQQIDCLLLRPAAMYAKVLHVQIAVFIFEK